MKKLAMYGVLETILISVASYKKYYVTFKLLFNHWSATTHFHSLSKLGTYG